MDGALTMSVVWSRDVPKKVGTLLHAAVSKTSHQHCLEINKLLHGIWDSTEQWEYCIEISCTKLGVKIFYYLHLTHLHKKFDCGKCVWAFPAEQNSVMCVCVCVSACVHACVPSDKSNTCEVGIVYDSKESRHLKFSCFRSAIMSVPIHCITKYFYIHSGHTLNWRQRDSSRPSWPTRATIHLLA